MGRGEGLSPVLPSPVALIAATHGQNGLLTGALPIAAISLLARSRPLLSGAAIGALAIKPHLALLLPFWLFGGRCWRTILAAGAALVALLLATLLAFGTATMRAYSTSWDASAALVAQGGPDFFLRMSTYYSQLRVHFGEPVAIGGGAVIALGMIGMALVAFRRFGGDARASGAAILAATALAPHYLFNYDLPFLILPKLWMVEQGLERGFRPYEKLLLVALWLAPYATRAAAFGIGVNLMPLAAFLLLALVWTRAPLPFSNNSRSVPTGRREPG